MGVLLRTLSGSCAGFILSYYGLVPFLLSVTGIVMLYIAEILDGMSYGQD